MSSLFFIKKLKSMLMRHSTDLVETAHKYYTFSTSAKVLYYLYYYNVDLRHSSKKMKAKDPTITKVVAFT